MRMFEKLKIELIHAATFKYTGTKDVYLHCDVADMIII